MISNQPKLASYFLLFFMGVSTSAAWGANPESIDWITEYSEARRAGIDQDRPVLLFVTTDGCMHCERMIDGAFKDSRVIGSLNNGFVPAQIKLSSNDELAKQLKVTLYPTTIIISTQGKILDYARGYLSTNDLKQRLSAVSTIHVASVD